MAFVTTDRNGVLWAVLDRADMDELSALFDQVDPGHLSAAEAALVALLRQARGEMKDDGDGVSADA